MVGLIKGSTFTSGGKNGIVGELLGEGGQGYVYRATHDGKQMALKWYKPEFLKKATNHSNNIQKLVEFKKPSDRFLWPEGIVTVQGRTEFGYLMELRDPQYASLNAYMQREVYATFRVAVRACYQLAQCFRQLHTSGFTYADISRGNAFLNVKTGDVLVCDNDNVVANAQEGGIIGTTGFAAPELLRREPGVRPSVETDLHALAVLMFQILFVEHPLEGARWFGVRSLDDAARNWMHATDPVFMFDPDNAVNRPEPGEQDAAQRLWERIYPTELRDAFIKTFTAGLKDPLARVRETTWMGIYADVTDRLVSCDQCRAEHFVDESKRGRTGAYTGSCWNCGRTIRPPAALLVGRRKTYLQPGVTLFRHHLTPNQSADFEMPEAQVRRHPTLAGVVGLTNDSGRSWVATVDGSTHQIPPGKSVTIAPGTVIQFGNGDTGQIVG